MYSNFAIGSAGLPGQWISYWHVISTDAEMTLIALLQNSSNSDISSWKPCARSRTKKKKKKQWNESHEWNEGSLQLRNFGLISRQGKSAHCHRTAKGVLATNEGLSQARWGFGLWLPHCSWAGAPRLPCGPVKTQTRVQRAFPGMLLLQCIPSTILPGGCKAAR